MFRSFNCTLFRLCQLLVNIMEWIRSKITGETVNHAAYESSARVYHVLGRFKYHEGLFDYSYGVEDMLLLSERYDHPSIVLRDNITLWNISSREAVFVDCGEFDVFSEDAAFMHVSQYYQAVKVITIPLESFKLVSSQITVPKCPIIHIKNHGRCGSTLMYRIFQTIPNCLSMSEPYALVQLAELSRKRTFSSDELIKLCKSVMKCLFKHANDRKTDIICMTALSMDIFIGDVMSDAWPTMKHIYLYRQPINFVYSWEKLSLIHNWKRSPVSAVMTRCGIGPCELMEGYPRYTEEYLEKLSAFGRWALRCIACNAAYNALLRKGYEIYSVKFEDFLKCPETMIQHIMRYFQLPAEIVDVQKALSQDSQRGTAFTSKHKDQKMLNKCLTPITDELKQEVDRMCADYGLESFWKENMHLENNVENFEN